MAIEYRTLDYTSTEEMRRYLTLFYAIPAGVDEYYCAKSANNSASGRIESTSENACERYVIRCPCRRLSINSYHRLMMALQGGAGGPYFPRET